MVLARVRSSQGPGAHAFFRAAPTDRERVIPPNEFVYATRRALGIEEYLATGCPRCHRDRDGGTITTMHARTCPRDGAQVNMHEPLKYALSRALNGLRVKHDVESGAPFTGEQNLSMDIVTRPGALSNSSSAEYRNKGILLDVTHADPQAQVHLRNGSATNDGCAARTSEARKRQHYARPGHVSFDERSFKLTTLAVGGGKLWPPWRRGLRVHRRTSDACRGRERWGIDGTERGLQGTTSSGHFGGYTTGGHLPQSPAVQAVTTRTSTRGGEKSRTSVEHINTNDLGLEC